MDRSKDGLSVGEREAEKAGPWNSRLYISLVSGFSIISIATMLLLTVPTDWGNYTTYLRYFLTGILLSIYGVYVKRLVSGLREGSRKSWKRMTVYRGNQISLLPSVGHHVDPHPTQIDLPTKEQIKVLSSSVALWYSFSGIVCIIILIITTQIVGTELFGNISSQFEGSQGLLPPVFAIFQPAAAIMYLVISAFSQDASSTIVLIAVVGIPGLISAPGSRNLQSIGEYAVSKLTAYLYQRLNNNFNKNTSKMLSVLIVTIAVFIGYWIIVRYLGISSPLLNNLI
ncbi:hypothetical protein [Halorubrum halophilum]|uniref:hypothetical protein n=1 Tax=Halorubrum halophilum TaxID=413816 RepID=UPI0012AC445A|nr:hypothetical protein [Halorubrum halophilum]